MKNKVLVKDIVDMPKELVLSNRYGNYEDEYNGGFNKSIQQIGNLEVNPDKLRELGWVKVGETEVIIAQKKEELIRTMAKRGWVKKDEDCENCSGLEELNKEIDRLKKNYIKKDKKFCTCRQRDSNNKMGRSNQDPQARDGVEI